MPATVKVAIVPGASDAFSELARHHTSSRMAGGEFTWARHTVMTARDEHELYALHASQAGRPLGTTLVSVARGFDTAVYMPRGIQRLLHGMRRQGLDIGRQDVAFVWVPHTACSGFLLSDDATGATSDDARKALVLHSLSTIRSQLDPGLVVVFPVHSPATVHALKSLDLCE